MSLAPIKLSKLADRLVSLLDRNCNSVVDLPTATGEQPAVNEIDTTDAWVRSALATYSFAPSRAQAWLQAADADGDGQLLRGEVSAYLKRFDSNKDGMIEEAELRRGGLAIAPAAPKPEAPRPQAPKPPVRQPEQRKPAASGTETPAPQPAPPAPTPHASTLVSALNAVLAKKP